MEDLPDELLLFIFNDLLNLEIQQRVIYSIVCKRWKNLLWKNIHEVSFKKIKKLKSHQFLQSFQCLLNRIQQISSLDVSRYIWFSDEAFKILMKFDCSKLIYLNLNYSSSNLTNAAIQTFFKYCSSLKHLYLSLNRSQEFIDDKTLETIVSSNTNLEVLEVRHSLITSNSLDAIANKLPRLTKLIVGDNMNLKVDMFQNISDKCIHLEELDISYLQISLNSVQNLIPMWNRLKYLNLKKCNGLNDKLLIELASYLKSVKTIILSSNQILVDAVKILCRKCHSLEYMELKNLVIYPSSLADLVDFYPKVEWLFKSAGGSVVHSKRFKQDLVDLRRSNRTKRRREELNFEKK